MRSDGKLADLLYSPDGGATTARSVFFFQAEDGIRDSSVTGVQTCALPIYRGLEGHIRRIFLDQIHFGERVSVDRRRVTRDAPVDELAVLGERREDLGRECRVARL